MPNNVRHGLHSRTQVSPFSPTGTEPFPCKAVKASSRHVAKATKGILASFGKHQASYLVAGARSAPHRSLRLGSGRFKGTSGSADSRSKDLRLGKNDHDVRSRVGGGPPPRLKLHAKHSVLRKISTALRVRIELSMDEFGPYIVIDDVTSAEILIIAQIFED